jgi:MscS family membrane protein
MKFLLLILFTFFSLLHAQELFWDKVQNIENEFYSIKNISVKDHNASKTLLDGDKSVLVDKKFALFNELVNILKSKPYEIEQGSKDFYDPKNFYTIQSKLNAKIAVNKEHGYSLAVLRDSLALENLHVKKHTFDFINNISKNWMNYDNNTTQTLIQDERDWLETISIKTYQKNSLFQSIDVNTSMGLAISNNYKALNKNYNFFHDFLYFLYSNPNVIFYENIVSKLNLVSIINNINKTKIAESVNIYLRYINLDIGRIILFVFIIIFFGLLNYAIYHYMYGFAKGLILKNSDDIDDLLLSNLELIRKPLLFLLLSFGFEIGLEILLYPTVFEEKDPYFYVMYLVVIVYILISLADNFFFELFLMRKNRKNIEVRKELLNLMISIVKAIIIIVAVLLFLIKIEVNITGILASLGIGGLAVALAAQNTLSNFFGLVKIIVDNSFSQGDWIVSTEIEGSVVEIGFISTKIRTFDNALITVPNAILANNSLKNWNRRSMGRRIKMHIGVGYNSKREDLQKAIYEIDNMLRMHSGIAVDVNNYEIKRKRKERKLVSTEDLYGIKSTLLVYLDKFSDSSIDVLIYAFTNTTNWQEWLEIKQDVYFKIWQILEENNLDFAYPSQSIYFEKENINESFGKLLPKNT